MKYLVLIIVSALMLGMFRLGYFALHAPGLISEEVVFGVENGESLGGIANRLSKNNLITSPLLFKAFSMVTGYSKKLKTGEYMLNRGMIPLEILKILASGVSLFHSITFPEGTNIYEMAQMFEEKGICRREEFLNLVTDPNFIYNTLGERVDSLEGYLFPETYKYTKYDGVKKIVSLMVKRFLDVYEDIKYLRKPNFTRHQWVTLASIVEKETGFKNERKLISSVFHNRLMKHMRLQTDPTVLYGILDETKELQNNITKSDLLKPNRYNTYTFSGLPYGPISNPGKEALEAAMQPASTSYLYFVSRNDGTSYFSSTLSEHNKAVQQFQLNRNAREGKSWRNLEQ